MQKIMQCNDVDSTPDSSLSIPTLKNIHGSLKYLQNNFENLKNHNSIQYAQELCSTSRKKRWKEPCEAGQKEAVVFQRVLQPAVDGRWWAAVIRATRSINKLLLVHKGQPANLLRLFLQRDPLCSTVLKSEQHHVWGKDYQLTKSKNRSQTYIALSLLSSQTHVCQNFTNRKWNEKQSF